MKSRLQVNRRPLALRETPDIVFKHLWRLKHVSGAFSSRMSWQANLDDLGRLPDANSALFPERRFS